MQGNNRFYQVKSQTNAVFIHTTAAIGFIKPVKDARNLFLGQSFTRIADSNICHSAFGIKAEHQIPVFTNKLDCVFNQVVHHLMNQVGIRIHHNFSDIQSADIQPFLFNRLLKGKQRLTDSVHDIQLLAIEFKLSCLNSGKIEHTPYQS